MGQQIHQPHKIEREPLDSRQVKVSDKKMRKMKRNKGINGSCHQGRPFMTGQMVDPDKHKQSSEDKGQQHGSIIGQRRSAQKGKRHGQNQHDRRDFGVSHVPTFGII